MKNGNKVRLWILLALIALAGTFSARLLGGGNTASVTRITGESSLYTEAEISKMMDTVERAFRKEFRGCTLTELEYDEEFSLKQSEDWARQYEADEAVVLLSSFNVDGSGGDGSLKPNSSYSRWMWVLTRDGNGAWAWNTWGY